MIPRKGILAVVAAAVAALAVGSAPASTNAWWTNCTQLHKRYSHGLGKLHAHDHTSGTPVTNFYRSTRLYNKAISYNSRLDADKDGIACEQH
jgi:hypothetical protein